LLPSDPSLQEIPVKLHANAETCPASRRLLCRRVIEQGRAVREGAEAARVSVRSAEMWLARFKAEGDPGSPIALPASSQPDAHGAGAPSRGS
jgi:hypothetical protein